MSYFQSKALLVAKALTAKDWSHPRALVAIRHAAHDGLTTRQIRDAFWPGLDLNTARRRLARFNIKARPVNDRARHGMETGFPQRANGINIRTYKAKVFREPTSL